MGVEWVEAPQSEPYIAIPWTIDKIANWKRALSARAGQALTPHDEYSKRELEELARLYSALTWLDDSFRMYHGLDQTGSPPAWVRKYYREV